MTLSNTCTDTWDIGAKIEIGRDELGPYIRMETRDRSDIWRSPFSARINSSHPHEVGRQAEAVIDAFLKGTRRGPLAYWVSER